jgi:hypothetical protein
MSWTTEQQARLNKEWEIVQKYFPSFGIKAVGAQLRLEGQMITNSNTVYELRLYVPSDVPNSIPPVVITYPYPVTDFSGKNLVEYGYSGTMHLLSPQDGYPRICTYKATHWNPNRTFYNVLMKVRIWLEALDGHKATARPLDHYLKHQL